MSSPVIYNGARAPDELVTTGPAKRGAYSWIA
jgi:hypothetical protein